jgi:diaminohydroxyphosphoribosylaminopyrimidine deaminase/5-amino-6-(5-phosphoribosylamino)uracil reductase
MERALELAKHGRGFAEPNPLVGAVIVQDDRIVGEGWHQRYGEPHAEINALAAAGDNAHGATMYVTLEPCCHEGKTPPCTDAIIRSGICRVVAAMRDPFPEVDGKGLELLRKASITVEEGLCEGEARRLNAPYLKLTQTGGPYVHAKWAMTLDGKIATRSGDSKWISSESSRRRTHEIRGRMDAIIVGGRTARTDDPLLTVRPSGPRTPIRVVLSRSGIIPSQLRLVQTARAVPTLLFTEASCDRSDLEALRDLGCEVVPIAMTPSRSVAREVLHELGRRRFTNVLLEGGAGLLGTFLEAREIDEIHVFIGRQLVGGKQALTPIGGTGVERLEQAAVLVEKRVELIGDEDIYVNGTVGWRRFGE